MLYEIGKMKKLQSVRKTNTVFILLSASRTQYDNFIHDVYQYDRCMKIRIIFLWNSNLSQDQTIHGTWLIWII